MYPNCYDPKYGSHVDTRISLGWSEAFKYAFSIMLWLLGMKLMEITNAKNVINFNLKKSFYPIKRMKN